MKESQGQILALACRQEPFKYIQGLPLRSGADATHFALWRAHDDLQVYLARSVFKAVVQKSMPTQIRQLILHVSYSKG